MRSSADPKYVEKDGRNCDEKSKSRRRLESDRPSFSFVFIDFHLERARQLQLRLLHFGFGVDAIHIYCVYVHCTLYSLCQCVFTLHCNAIRRTIELIKANDSHSKSFSLI